MIYIEAPYSDSEIPVKESIFIAGGITRCPQWQDIVVSNLSGYFIKIYNPRRKHFDINKKEDTKIQIEWEYNNLRKSTQILFWFPYSRSNICPIVLYELGGALERKNQKLFIGCDMRYIRYEDVEIQARLAGFTGKIHRTLSDITVEAMEYNKELKDP